MIQFNSVQMHRRSDAGLVECGALSIVNDSSSCLFKDRERWKRNKVWKQFLFDSREMSENSEKKLNQALPRDLDLRNEIVEAKVMTEKTFCLIG